MRKKLIKSVVFLGFMGLAAVYPLWAKPVATPLLSGVKFDSLRPYDLEFFIDKDGATEVSKEEVARLVRYFLAGLTLSSGELWVNLSPDEPERIIPADTARTELGKLFLQQDYALKQLAASLTYPDSRLGKKYWDTVKGSGNVLQRIWIMPGKAEVYSWGNSVIIQSASLKVMAPDGSPRCPS